LTAAYLPLLLVVIEGYLLTYHRWPSISWTIKFYITQNCSMWQLSLFTTHRRY